MAKQDDRKPIAQGDVVQLVSGGADLTVICIDATCGMARCAGFSGTTFVDVTLPLACFVVKVK